MNSEEIKTFARSALVVIIQDILERNIIVPGLVFDESTHPTVNTGYYMYQNIVGNIITLNMRAIKELKTPDDIKTVITYGFIHEIVHMYQPINSSYFIDKNYYTMIEDSADKITIEIIELYKFQIEARLHFKFNDAFPNGIKKQLVNPSMNFDVGYDATIYGTKCITGAICQKMNSSYDYIYNFIINNTNTGNVKIIFPDKREFYYDHEFPEENLNALINLILLTDIKFVRLEIEEEPCYKGLPIIHLYG